MKCLAIGLISLVSFTVLAQSQRTDVKIEERLERLNNLVRQGRHTLLSQIEQKEVLKNINLSISLIKDDQEGGRPGQGNPPTPPMPARVKAVGRMGNKNFSFDAPTVGALFNQCSDWARTSVSSVNVIRVSFNDKAYLFLKNTNWWTNPDAICNAIYEQATPLNLMPDRLQPLVIEGYLGQKKVAFSGQSTGVVFNTCIHWVESNLSSINVMEISVNGDRRYRTNNPNWWTNPEAICTAAFERVPK